MSAEATPACEKEAILADAKLRIRELKRVRLALFSDRDDPEVMSELVATESAIKQAEAVLRADARQNNLVVVGKPDSSTGTIAPAPVEVHPAQPWEPRPGTKEGGMSFQNEIRLPIRDENELLDVKAISELPGLLDDDPEAVEECREILWLVKFAAGPMDVTLGQAAEMDREHAVDWRRDLLDAARVRSGRKTVRKQAELDHLEWLQPSLRDPM